MKSIVRRALRRLGWDMHRFPEGCECMDAHLTSLFARHSFDLLLDVGANVGQFGDQARACGYRGPIVSFEPNPAAASQLARRAEADGRWIVKPFALGRVVETLQLNVMAADDFSSFLEPSALGRESFPLGSQVSRVVEAPVKRLDDELGQCLHEASSAGDSILLKLDTQGFDNAVLDGAAQSIERAKGVITEVAVQPIYEGAPRYLESLDRLERAGFTLLALLPVVRGRERSVVEFNCLMVRLP